MTEIGKSTLRTPARHSQRLPWQYASTALPDSFSCEVFEFGFTPRCPSGPGYCRSARIGEAVTGVVTVAIVIAPVCIVAHHCLDVGLVEDRANQALIDVGSGVQGMPDDVDPGSSPFDDQDEAVDERRRRANIDQGGQRWEVDNDVVIGRP